MADKPAVLRSDKRFVLLKDVVIPAGTILSRASNERGGAERVEATVEMGRDATAWLNMAVAAIPDAPDELIAEAR
jgi:hypothetical protein